MPRYFNGQDGQIELQKLVKRKRSVLRSGIIARCLIIPDTQNPAVNGEKLTYRWTLKKRYYSLGWLIFWNEYWLVPYNEEMTRRKSLWKVYLEIYLQNSSLLRIFSLVFCRFTGRICNALQKFRKMQVKSVFPFRELSLKRTKSQNCNNRCTCNLSCFCPNFQSLLDESCWSSSPLGDEPL